MPKRAHSLGPAPPAHPPPVRMRHLMAMAPWRFTPSAEVAAATSLAETLGISPWRRPAFVMPAAATEAEAEAIEAAATFVMPAAATEAEAEETEAAAASEAAAALEAEAEAIEAEIEATKVEAEALEAAREAEATHPWCRSEVVVSV
jgi:hypothetical protein